MIKPNIKQIAERNGITTAYQLQKLLGIQPSLAAKWYRNDLKMIGFESLNTLCKAFNCQVGDLVVFTPDDDANAANDTKSSNIQFDITNVQNTLSDITNVQNTFNSKLNNEKPIKGLYELDKDDMWLETKQIAEFTDSPERFVPYFFKRGLPFEKIKRQGKVVKFVKLSDLTVFWKNRTTVEKN
jgi:putative transcriptional regulator